MLFRSVDLKTQPTPYDLILNAMTLKAAYADVFEIKDLQIYGVGTASASTPNSLTAVNEVLQNNMLKDVRVVKGVMSFTIDNANSTSSKLYLHNVLGSKVLEQNINPGLSTCSIPVSGIASGVYLLTFESAGNRCSQKLIIQ